MKYKFSKKQIVNAVRRIAGRGSAESIARGASLGLFVGFFVFLGLQIAIVLPLAFIFRAQRVVAVTFTFVTNYATAFIIYPIQCYVGAKILGRELNVTQVRRVLKDLASDFSYEKLFNAGSDFLLSFSVGGFVIGIIAAIIAYPIVLHSTRKIQQQQTKLKIARRAKRKKLKEKREL